MSSWNYLPGLGIDSESCIPNFVYWKSDLEIQVLFFEEFVKIALRYRIAKPQSKKKVLVFSGGA